MAAIESRFDWAPSAQTQPGPAATGRRSEWISWRSARVLAKLSSTLEQRPQFMWLYLSQLGFVVLCTEELTELGACFLGWAKGPQAVCLSLFLPSLGELPAVCRWFSPPCSGPVSRTDPRPGDPGWPRSMRHGSVLNLLFQEDVQMELW